MNNYNKIYNNINHLEYTVDTENINLICIIEKSKKNWLVKRQYYTWTVYLDRYNVFTSQYDVKFYSNWDKYMSLDRCIEDLELFIKNNFIVK